MAVLISDYKTDTLNKLPSFTEAGLKFDSVDGKAFIAGIMAPLFQKHEVENFLGLQLLHQHFTLQPGGRLVDFNGTSDLEQSGDQLQLHPLEFMLNSGITNLDQASQWSDPNSQKFVFSTQSFFQIFSTEVNEHGVKGLFGLTRYPGDGFSGRVEVRLA
ncbi:uncharacterized protein L3040_003292 [Drepanopeziza brunnea f. sp. 'multigermtubi']|uniref:uncharacterized protein n=1 Tax=Drepanopeziza brunnea f. sp. 'multigermtubi' TaxID=698441 RepID=UPI0023A20EF1|nr:hypothetical protein L3040_003292 [Drepanopeziza brunnea f. sp. 'multigermtubi']